MACRTVQFLLNVNEDPPADAVIDYAVEFARREQAHLSVLQIAQRVELPVLRVLPLAEAIVDEINDERFAKAETLGARIEVAARLAGVGLDRAVEQRAAAAARHAASVATRLCDLAIVARPRDVLFGDRLLVEEVIFSSGRPVLVVPADWTAGPTLERIVVAWDGGARAARAVGDAMPLLEKAGEIEIVCVTGEPDDTRGAALARHLSRHCARVSVTNLPFIAADAGRTLLRHVESMPVNLVVMGAFAHARLMERVIGGATDLMLTEARTPVLYAF